MQSCRPRRKFHSECWLERRGCRGGYSGWHGWPSHVPDCPLVQLQVQELPKTKKIAELINSQATSQSKLVDKSFMYSYIYEPSSALKSSSENTYRNYSSMNVNWFVGTNQNGLDCLENLLDRKRKHIVGTFMRSISDQNLVA